MDGRLEVIFDKAVFLRMCRFWRQPFTLWQPSVDNVKDRLLPATGERELFFFYFAFMFHFDPKCNCAVLIVLYVLTTTFSFILRQNNSIEKRFFLAVVVKEHSQ